MNITRAREGLISSIENEYTLRYPDNSEVENGDEVLIYGQRRARGDSIKWYCKKVVPYRNESNSEANIEEKPGHQQLTLSGTVRKSGKRDKISLENVSVEDRSPIDKCKEKVTEIFCQIWYIGWPEVYIRGRNAVSLDSRTTTNSKLRPVETDDVKVTTVWGKNKAMHLGRGDVTDNYIFKLGVDWSTWHSLSPTRRIANITHEITHCRYPHHKGIFFKEHARMISNITGSEERKERVSSLVSGEVQWDKLKTLCMKGVHSQPKEIDISGHPHRRSACDAVVEEMEEILDYSYPVGRTIHLNPPTTEIYPKWIIDTPEDFENQSDPTESLRPRDDIESVKVMNLEIDCDVSDEELYHFLQSLHKDHLYIYSVEELPVVEDGEVIENSKLAVLYKRLINESNVMTEDGFKSDIEVPVIQQKT